MPPPAPPSPLPTIAVDLRALVREPTGIGVYTLALLRELASRGNARYLGMAHRDAAAAAGVPGLEREHHPAPLGVLWQQLRLPRRLARGDIDLLWSPLMTLPRRLPVPAVVTVHDLTAVLYPETHRLKVRLSILPFLRHTIADARIVVTDSQATADDLLFQFPEARPRLRVVPLGVDRELVPGNAESIAATRAKLGAPDGYALYAGTLEPRKNLGILLDAWESLAGETDLPLLLAGGYGWHSGGLVARARALARRDGRVRLLGRLERDQLVRVFQAATLFVYPSLYEGFGLPPAEALACGVPVVASSASSLPEVVGDAGLLVDPNDGAGLAAAMRRVLGDAGLRSALAARGLERAGLFRWERAAAAMDEVFAEALAFAPSRRDAER